MLIVMRGRGQGVDAFTLTELLVVIAIIALLTAIAVPFIQGAVSKGHDAKCASNLKTLSAGVLAYCADNNGLFPNPAAPNNGTQEDFWHRQISVYLGAKSFDDFKSKPKMQSPFLCPGDTAPYFNSQSYGLNSDVREPSGKRKRLLQATRTSAIMIADSSNPSLTPARVKTNHAGQIHFVRLDGSFGRATNAGTVATSPELWKISY
jgi:prepilin-type N-terminal cleavage/methylation domain-containing protein